MQILLGSQPKLTTSASNFKFERENKYKTCITCSSLPFWNLVKQVYVFEFWSPKHYKVLLYVGGIGQLLSAFNISF